MRFIIALLTIFVFQSSFAQVTPGFKPTEARDMIAICNSFTYLNLYRNDDAIIPKGYQRIYTSDIIGMDNKFQVYVNKNIAVINLRGSTNQKNSWLENFNSAMIPATGKIRIGDDNFYYQFAETQKAAVHGGFALAVMYLSQDITRQILELNANRDIYHIFITGHSQGGALSQLLRSYLENEKGKSISDKNVFKTYAFASPKIGNQEFATEYDSLYANGTSFNIVNPADLIPTFPLSYSERKLFSQENLIEFIEAPTNFDYKDKLIDGTIQHFENFLTAAINKTGQMVSNEISRDLDDVILPEYVNDINFQTLKEVIAIPPTPYPLILNDSSILENDSLMAVYTRSDNGDFEDETLYKKQSLFFQHKPYNYYATILKIYFPEDYEALENKYFIKPD